jgi:hypothetical protein
MRERPIECDIISEEGCKDRRICSETFVDVGLEVIERLVLPFCAPESAHIEVRKMELLSIDMR